MKMIRMLSMLTMVAMLFLTPLARAAFVPATVSYQGSMYNTDGTPFSGVKAITFSLYTTATGGTSIWNETQTDVNVVNGRFATILGKGSALNPAIFTTDVWLGVTVSGDAAELSPRQQLTSVAFAFNAVNATTATNLAGGSAGAIPYQSAAGATAQMTAGTAGQILMSNGTGAPTWVNNSMVPVGGIIMWSGTVAEITAMDGWVLCDGSTKDGKTCPDLRGRFIIGAGGSYAPRASGGNERHFHKGFSDGGDLRASVGFQNNVGIGTLSTGALNPNTNVAVTVSSGGLSLGYLIGTSGGGSTPGPIDYFSGVYGYTSVGFPGTPSFGANGSTSGSLPPYYALAYIMRTK